ncbi:DxFTY motif-containing membrane protein [Spiroplasma taiwanense]|uniref:Transmembrane protein n=1 Tax=Spiroplasma taiwanense CT-1 TaxID=1276220 RepID=S5LWM8_9MOLU|nr:hypothetical protein [Spiroplasma taiwanense]AGR41041.1 hypothetical protein STAIW_v1c03910 [Spiroplasma taiwanense CT-1]
MIKNFFDNFNQNRTPFFISSFFLLVESIIPGFAIWFLIGFDFSFSMNFKLPSPIGLYIFFICLGYFFYTFLITLIFYKLKLHKTDNFIYSLTISLIFIIITSIGSFLENATWMIIVKFLIVTLLVVFLIPLFVFISIFFRNQELRKQEDLEKIYNAFKNNEIIPTKELLKAQRYEKYLIKKMKEKEELAQFKLELDEKLEKELNKKELLKKEKFKKINEKLDKKEQKLRDKETK